jgi:hypothetical protein
MSDSGLSPHNPGLERSESDLWQIYLRDPVNRSHAAAVKASVPPSRFVVSRTRIVPSPLAVSMQFPPLSFE